MSAVFAPALDCVASALRAAGCVFAEAEAHLLITEARTAADLARMLNQRIAGLPVEQNDRTVARAGSQIRTAGGAR
jgi:hypothetical protein